MTYRDDFPIVLSRFEGQAGTFNNFQDITEEDYQRIKELVATFQKNKGIDKDKLERYIDVLSYLTSPKAHLSFKNFDEKALFMILALDKNIISFKTYLRTPNPEVTSTEHLSEEEKRKYISSSIPTYQTKIREQLGFYNRLLIIFEQAYYRKYLKDKINLNNIQKNYYKNFFKSAAYIKDFEEITEEDYQRISLALSTWLKDIPETPNVNTIIFALTEQREVLKLHTLKEQYLFLIMALDPEFKMLKIYENESRLDAVEKRCIEEFGFFNLRLIKLELDYHNRFRSDEFISVWHNNKKKQ